VHRRMLSVLIVAGFIGLAAAILVYRAVAQMQTARQPATDTVVVAAVNMALGDTIAGEHVKLARWPASAIPDGAARRVTDVEGRIVRTSIVAGEPILEPKLAPSIAGRGGIMPMLVPDGERGVTIKVDDAVKESGFIQPNSRVDVFANLARTADSRDRVAKLILQDVLVLAAGQTVEMRDNKPVAVTTVTLSLTPAQIERLALAQVEGKLFLGTRNLSDKRLVETSGATREALLTAAPSASPDSGRASHTPRPAVTYHRIGIVRAEKVSEQVFVRAGAGWIEQTEATK